MGLSWLAVSYLNTHGKKVIKMQILLMSYPGIKLKSSDNALSFLFYLSGDLELPDFFRILRDLKKSKP